jgi:hypothetical protein
MPPRDFCVMRRNSRSLATVASSYSTIRMASRCVASPPRPAPSADQIPGPDGGTPYQLSVPNGVTQVGTVTSIRFDAQGRPNTGASLSITGDQTVRTLTVEAETGYVH